MDGVGKVDGGSRVLEVDRGGCLGSAIDGTNDAHGKNGDGYGWNAEACVMLGTHGTSSGLLEVDTSEHDTKACTA